MYKIHLDVLALFCGILLKSFYKEGFKIGYLGATVSNDPIIVQGWEAGAHWACLLLPRLFLWPA
jgi:hypothetical protein